MRSSRILYVTLFLALSPAHAADAPAETKSLTSACTSQTPGGDYRDVVCPLPAAESAGHYRFKVNFSGGHDDTMASMSAKLDQAPLSCEPGSKMDLMGEDGDVFLECRFSPAPKAAHELQMIVRWKHAQYTNFELTAH